MIFMGENSLLYYFFQNQIIKGFNILYSKLHINSPDYIMSLVMLVFVCLILIIPILLVKRFFPIVTGKTKILSKYLRDR
jgi:transposase